MDYRTLHLLLRCGKEFSHAKLRMQELSETECMLCSYIFSNADCTQEAASTALKIDKTTAAKALLSLENKGYILRTKDAADKRVKRLRITQTGREKIASLVDIHNDWLSEILTVLSPQEQQQFESCCARLLAAAQALAEKRNTEEKQNA